MKILIAYYTYTGNTKTLCEKIKTEECDLYEIVEVRKKGFLSAFLGCFKAIRGVPSKIHPISVNVSDYDLVIVAGPIWGGSIAPAVNAFLRDAKLENKDVIVVAMSGNGADYSAKIKAVALSAKVNCVNIYNVETGADVNITEIKS